MRYREVPPPPLLAPWLRCLWLLEDPSARGGTGAIERILPDGCVEVIVHYGTPMLRCADEAPAVPRNGAGLLPGSEPQPRSIVAGQLRGATRLLPAGPIGMVAARFQPWAAAPFLREPLDRLTGHIVPLDALWGADARRLEERVAATTGDERRWAVLLETLAARLLPADEPMRALRAAVGWIAESRGAIGVDPIARRLGWSRRRLERRFATAVGLPPKALCRIERFRHVVAALGQPRPRRLVELALAAGYADQAHLARDFRDLAGLPVTAWLAEQHVLSDHLTGGA